MHIEFYRHSLGEDEKESVFECLDGIFLTTGSYVDRFEKDFASLLGSPYCVGLSSCTAALHLSLLALGIGPEHEVITSPLTFIASSTAILHTGAKPVFVDVDPRTGLIDPEKIEQVITEKTKAILPIHLYGQMCDMSKISDIAGKYNLKIVEDAAHCLEGERDGIKPGQYSDVACFSFYATKNITSGEGGAIVTKDKNLALKIKLLRLHGMSSEAADRYQGPYRHWDMVECGWKYNMDNIQAALLLPQLKKIDYRWQQRKERYEYYQSKLLAIRSITIPKIDPGVKHGFHLFTILVDPDRRDRILSQLGSEGIGVAVNYRAIHLLTYFSKQFGFRPGTFPHAEKIGSSTISLPFYPTLPFDQIDIVVENLINSLNQQETY